MATPQAAMAVVRKPARARSGPETLDASYRNDAVERFEPTISEWSASRFLEYGVQYAAYVAGGAFIPPTSRRSAP